MNNAIAFLETNSHFEHDDMTGDSDEVIYITDAHKAVYIGILEALESLKPYYTQYFNMANKDEEANTPTNVISEVVLNNLINKYKKKL